MAEDGSELSGVAGRYATALYSLAVEKNAVDDVSASLASFQRMMSDSADLARLVKSPAFSVGEQVGAISRLLSKAQISGPAANFIKLVATKRRLFALPAMITAYQRRVDDAKGVTRAKVTVAAPLKSEHERALQEALAAVAGGKSVALQVQTDPSIIGGLIVQLGSRMVDASLKTKLNAIRTRMKEVG